MLHAVKNKAQVYYLPSIEDVRKSRNPPNKFVITVVGIEISPMFGNVTDWDKIPKRNDIIAGNGRIQVNTRLTLGKLPWKCKIPLQGNGMDAIPKRSTIYTSPLSHHGWIKNPLKLCLH